MTAVAGHIIDSPWDEQDMTSRLVEDWQADHVELVGYHGTKESLRLRLSWRDPVSARAFDPRREARTDLTLRLVPKLLPWRMDSDALGWFVGSLARRSRPYRSIRGLPTWHQHLVPAANAIAAKFLSKLDPERLAVVRRYDGGVRAFLYTVLATDRSGRLAQLARAQPGATLFFLGLSASQDATETALAELFREGIDQGGKLDRLLDASLEVLLEHRASGHASSVDTALLDAYRWLDQAPKTKRARQLLRWRMLLRRAGRKVDFSLLLRPPPLGFVPEDIPRKVDANAGWYAGMNSHDAFIVPHLAGSEETCRRLGMTLSGRGGRVASLLANRFFFEWLQAHPDLDTRRLSARDLAQRSSDHWAATHRPDAADERPFPPTPVTPPNSPDLRLVPLTNAEQLRREGESMRHCVGGYVRKVQRRESYVYAAHVGAERLTVEVEPSGPGQWRIAQIRGVANAAPKPESVATLHAWCPPKPVDAPSTRFRIRAGGRLQPPI